MSLLPDAPHPSLVVAPDGVSLACYDVGPETGPVVLAVHGFASSAYANWFATGWTRDLTRAGYRVVAFDQRGHGASDKPHHPGGYSMELLVRDVVAVIDTYLLDEVRLVGYSLGARVGWHTASALPQRFERAVLGGIPDGDPLTRFRVDEARAYLEHEVPLHDTVTASYLLMASRIPGNDPAALVSLVEGMRGGPQPDPQHAPHLPMLFAAGSEDHILSASRSLAAMTPGAEFFEIPSRNHFNAPTSREFRAAALAYLERED